LGIVAGLVTGLALPVMATTASSTTTTVVTVGASNVATQAENTPPTKNWVLYTRNDGAGQFRAGPGTPPIGHGSVELNTFLSTDKVQLFNYDWIGKPLSSIDAIGYATYRETGNAQQVAAINVEVDVNGTDPGGFTTLVFEPVYNTDQGPVASGQWQHWDAFNGGNAMWWSSRNIPGVCAFDCYATWSQIVAAHPNAVIGGGFGLNQGSGNPALLTSADALSLGINGSTTTYNFDVPPASKDDCKNGGWATFSIPTTFRNQGACVSSMTPAKKK
jgi:hypothetical protein